MTWVPLKRLVDEWRPVTYGIVLPGPNQDSGPLIIKGGDVKPGGLDPTRLCRTTVEIESRYARSRVQSGDIVIAIRGGVGDTALVPTNVAGANLTQDAARIAPRRGVEPRWLHYCLRSSPVQADVSARVTGATIRGLNIEELDEVRISTPPSLAEQRVIADYLDVETARIDALIVKKQQLIRLLEERIDALVFRGVSGRLTSADAPTKDSGLDWLGPVPVHFGTPTLGANFSTQLGKMLNAGAAAGPDQHPYVKNTNVKWDSFDLSDLPTMSFDARDRARCELRVGDLLVCEGGEVGRSAIWPGSEGPIFFQKALHRVRPIRDGNTRFLMYCLWAAASLDVFSVEGNQATIVHLTGEKLREHRLPWPREPEQDEIVHRIDEGRSRITALKRRVRKQIDLLAEHRQALITAAVTGEFAVPGAA